MEYFKEITLLVTDGNDRKLWVWQRNSFDWILILITNSFFKTFAGNFYQHVLLNKVTSRCSHIVESLCKQLLFYLMQYRGERKLRKWQKRANKIINSLRHHHRDGFKVPQFSFLLSFIFFLPFFSLLILFKPFLYTRNSYFVRN